MTLVERNASEARPSSPPSGLPLGEAERPVAGQSNALHLAEGERRGEGIPAQVAGPAVAAQSNALHLAEGENWYVVRTQPRKEAMAEINLHRQGFRTFLPRLTKTVRHARQARTVKAPLFPGYLFTPLDMTRDQWRRINGSFGVLSLIMGGDQPKPVPHGVVEELIALAGAGNVVDWGRRLTPGGPVRVLTGPFADQLGTLESLDDHGRARVLLEIMGAARTVTLEGSALFAAA